MTVDYDLVVIGNTPAAVQAAIAAANLKARVALVTQCNTVIHQPELFTLPALTNLGRTVEQFQQLQTFPLWQKPTLAPREALRWDWVKLWMDAIALNLTELRSPTVLAQLGVDAIDACGEFCRKPSPGFIVEQRFLKARTYLIASAPLSTSPNLPGLETVNHSTVHTLEQELPTWKPGDRVAVIGETASAIGIAQTMAKLGFKTSLLGCEAGLSNADLHVQHWIKARLEAAGIRVLAQAGIRLKNLEFGTIQIQTEQNSIAVDRLILVGKPSLDRRSLNLDAVHVRSSQTQIQHNLKLQTTNPNIYVCPGILGTDYFPHVAAYEAQIAVKNALFFPRLRANYGKLPIAIATEPEVAWIGMTEATAQHRYGKHVITTTRSFNTLPKAQVHSDLSGFCKLIGHRNGTLLGAHLVGAHATEWIGTIALAMQQNLNLSDLARLVLPSPSYAEIIPQTAIAWQQEQLNQRHRLRDGLDLFFDWRRSWF
jgi:pyruvate/2-oxoglutarate dehydrogenase complex dihydrolipoamide dehydrogenase (E3) component